MVLSLLDDCALGLAKCPLGSVRRLRQRSAERGYHEPIGLLLEREARALARAAHDPAGRGGETVEMVARSAGGACSELGDDARRQQQLQPKGEPVRGPRMAFPLVQQRQLADE